MREKNRENFHVKKKLSQNNFIAKLIASYTGSLLTTKVLQFVLLKKDFHCLTVAKSHPDASNPNEFF